jgi:hypothetical protein
MGGRKLKKEEWVLVKEIVKNELKTSDNKVAPRVVCGLKRPPQPPKTVEADTVKEFSVKAATSSSSFSKGCVFSTHFSPPDLEKTIIPPFP